MKFPDFLAYVNNNLRAPGVPLPLIINGIEQKCWSMAEDTYKSEALNKQDLYKVMLLLNTRDIPFQIYMKCTSPQQARPI